MLLWNPQEMWKKWILLPLLLTPLLKGGAPKGRRGGTLGKTGLFLRVDVGGDLLHHFRKGGVFLDHISHLVAGVHDGGMISAELHTDLG